MLTRSGDRQFRWLICPVVVFGLTLAWGWVVSPSLYGQEPQSARSADGDGKSKAAVSAEARRLIEALGSDSYATRMRARDQLQRMGLEAFDELRIAKDSLDSEIALAAKALVAGYSIVWFESDDPPLVRETLEEYGAQPVAERQSRIVMLGEFPDRIGLRALVRIARFERSTALSRKAAIVVMEQAADKDPAKRKANVESIMLGLATADRQSADWLRVYAGDLSAAKYSVDEWRELIRTQRDAVDALTSEEVTRESVLNLVRICAVRAASLGYREAALQLATENADLVSAATTDLIAASNWATDNGLHEFVVDLYARNRPMFDRSAVLLYGYANALKVGGEESEAERMSDMAYRLSPLSGSKQAIEAMQPKELEENAKLRREIAQKLRDRGMFQWAEREYRNVIDSMPVEDLDSVMARGDLSRMYGELERHQDVIDVLSPVLDRMAKDDVLRAKLMSGLGLGRTVTGWQARVDYHTALLDLKKSAQDASEGGELLEKARKQMMAAFLANPLDIDVLIKMYRTEGDVQWRAEVKQRLETAKQGSQSRVTNLEAALARGRPTRDANLALAEYLNNYAWLVCNTEGDLQLALKYSLRSLDIVEDSAKLDTCGRCYFAVGDLENAIKVQKRALAIDPYSPPLKRQLAEFEAAKAKADAEAADIN